MKTYFNLLRDKLLINQRIRVEKKVLHHKFVAMNKKSFLYMDILIGVMVLLNMGALVMTNALVVKATPEVELREVNPAMAEVHDYEVHPKSNQLIKVFIKQVVLWAILVLCYMYYRTRVFTDMGFTTMWVFVLYFLTMYLVDFVNDFGYLIGKIMFGG